MIPADDVLSPVDGRSRAFRVAATYDDAVANNFLQLRVPSRDYWPMFLTIDTAGNMPTSYTDVVPANTSGNTGFVYLSNHGFRDGVSVTVDEGQNMSTGFAPFGLVYDDATTYTVEVITNDIFRFKDSSNNIVAWTPYRGLAYLPARNSSGSSAIDTSGNVAISEPRDSFIIQGTIASIVDDTTASTEEPILPAGSDDVAGVNYFLNSRVLPRSQAFAVHRSFDGGMEITTGTEVAGAQIVRQSRRYFRYQSGKGLQISKAINFKPPIEVDDIAMANTVALTTTTANVVSGSNVSTLSADDASLFPANGVLEIVDNTESNTRAEFVFSGRTNTEFTISSTTWFNDIEEGDFIRLKADEPANQKWINVRSKFAHGLKASANIVISNSQISNTSANNFNGTFTIDQVNDELNFQLYYGDSYPDQTIAEGFPLVYADSWVGSEIRAGMFDFQNGMFFEFDGSVLSVVRRDSTQKLHGTVDATLRSNDVLGNDTKFTRQLTDGDYIVIRGQSYKVNKIISDTQLEILPEYRGDSTEKAVVTKTVDTKIPQSQWNLDTCDGTGQSGYTLDLSKIQMCYIDYSWYGAGAIRFGFKDQNGKVIYCHKFRHNNQRNIAYLRSGNLPARYEVNNSSTSNYTPSLAHWGTSVIMDGEFEDDNAYFFTAFSDELTESGGAINTADENIPILSIRLAPSVDSGSSGGFGARDIINRMQLQMARIDVATTDTLLIQLILNPELSTGTSGFTNNTRPSLTQFLKHSVDATNLDSVSGGDVVYQFIAQGTTTSRFTGLRPTTTTVDLGELVTLGNSIIGGKEVFPDGPDVLTVTVTPLEDFDADSRASVSLSWSESQA